MKKNLFKTIVLVMALCGTASLVQAQKIWVGGTGSWNIAANWSPVGVPTVTDNVSIAAGNAVTIPAAYVAVAKRISLGGSLNIIATGSLAIDGSSGDAIQGVGAGSPSLVNAGTLTIGNTTAVTGSGISMGIGSVNNQATGVIEINNSSSIGIDISSSHTFTNAGIIKIGNIGAIAFRGIRVTTGASFTNQSTGSIEINRITQFEGIWVSTNVSTNFSNAGSIKIGNIAAVNGGGILLIDGTFTNDASGIVEIDNITTGNTISFTSGLSSLTNNGTMKIGLNSAVAAGITGGRPFNNNGSINWGTVAGTGINTGQTLSNNSGGSITVNTGKTLNIKGVLDNKVGATLTNNGTLSGTGTLINAGTLANDNGIIAPGNSPGKLNITGNYPQGNGTLNIEIGGTTQGTDYDWLAVNGAATLGGTLNINFVNGFTPISGQYRFLTATPGSMTGSHSTINIPNGVIGLIVNFNATQAYLLISPAEIRPKSTISACSGGSISLSAATTLGFTPTGYAWSSSPAGFSSTQANPTFTVPSVSVPTIYTISLTVSNSVTSAVVTKQVTVNPLPVVTISSNSPVSIGSMLSLLATGGDSYAWTCPNGKCPNGFVSTIANPLFVASVPCEGIYSVTAIRNNGCTSSATVLVSLIPIPVTSPTCAGGTLMLRSPMAPLGAHTWTGPNGYKSNTAQPNIKNMTSEKSGIYTVSITYNNNIIVGTVAVNVPTPTSVNITSNSPVSEGGILQLSTNAVGDKYAWNGPKGFNSSLQSPKLSAVKLTNAGIYSLTVTGSTGCFSTGTISVRVLNTTASRLASKETDSESITLDAYPNPTTGQLTVTITLDEPMPVLLKLHNLMGKEIDQWSVTEPTQTHQLMIDISDYPQGIYVLHAENGKKHITKKILKAE